MPHSVATRRANEATAGDLAISVQPTHVLSNKSFFFSVKTISDVCDDERDQIWHMLEENMSELYRSSSFGWKPQKKRREMFHTLSRFIIVRDLLDTTRPIVAYTIFRFEREARQNVVYCYELQVSKDLRRFGLGRLLVQMLSDIGSQWGMKKIMLTVFKANHAAMLFYKSTGFSIDEMSPDFPDDSQGGGEGEQDYSILSRLVP